MNCHLNLYIQISTLGYTNFVRKSKILTSTAKKIEGVVIFVEVILLLNQLFWLTPLTYKRNVYYMIYSYSRSTLLQKLLWFSSSSKFASALKPVGLSKSILYHRSSII